LLPQNNTKTDHNALKKKVYQLIRHEQQEDLETTYCSKRILLLSLRVEADKAVFAIFARWFHVILPKHVVLVQTK